MLIEPMSDIGQKPCRGDMSLIAETYRPDRAGRSQFLAALSFSPLFSIIGAVARAQRVPAGDLSQRQGFIYLMMRIANKTPAALN